MRTNETVIGVETTIVDVPLQRHYSFRGVDMTSQALLIVRLLTDGGSEGLGEGSVPLDSAYPSETVETMEYVIDHYLSSAIIGLPTSCPGRLRTAMDAAIGGHLLAKAALESAAYDAWARSLDVPVSTLLGGARREAVPVTWLLTPTDPFEAAEEARVVTQAAGYDAVTIRLGADASAVSLACAIARLLDGHTNVHVDAGGDWGRIPALLYSSDLAAAGVNLIEQPCRASDVDTLARLTNRLEVAIAADESVTNPYEAHELARRSAVDVFTLHPGKCGGLGVAQAIAHIAGGAEIACRVGTGFCGEIGAATALQLAVTLPQLPFGTDIFGPQLMAEPLVDRPLDYRDGTIQVPRGPGIGVTLDRSSLGGLARH